MERRKSVFEEIIDASVIVLFSCNTLAAINEKEAHAKEIIELKSLLKKAKENEEETLIKVTSYLSFGHV